VALDAPIGSVKEMSSPEVTSPHLPDHVPINRGTWNEDAENWVDGGRRNWAAAEPSWGTFDVSESEVHVLPDDLAGKDVIELGCGTAYVSSWLARRGARPIGLDLSERQLATARQFQEEFGIRFPLVHANAEAVPLASESFDVAISEYGASHWCDPYRWIPEAARVLRPNGELIFLVNGTLMMLTVPDYESEGPATTTLRRDYFGMHRFEWPDDPSIEFHLGYGDWLRLLRRAGFEITDLIEVRPPEGAEMRYPYVTPEWARRWPSEEVWKARKR
jgi:SAM-dependent methyltransferase